MDDHGRLTAVGAMWARQLAGLSETALVGAIDYFAGRLDWPPSLAELRRAALGIPTFEQVRADITKRTHQFTVMVWQYVDSWAFTRADDREATRILRAAYDHAAERRMAGDALPVITAEIEHTPRPHMPATPDQVRAHAERIREALSRPEPAPEPQPERERIDLAAVERELQAHYSQVQAHAA